MLSLGSNGSRTKKTPRPTPPTPSGSPGGYAHQACSCAPSGKEIRPSLTRPQLLLGARGLPEALGSRSTAPPSSTLGSCPANDASQGPGTRRQTPGYRCPGAPRRRPQGVPLPTAPPTGSRPGRDTRRQLPRGLRLLRGFWAHASTPGADLLRHQEDSRRSSHFQSRGECWVVWGISRKKKDRWLTRKREALKRAGSGKA
jgi:hypothetical protein